MLELGSPSSSGCSTSFNFTHGAQYMMGAFCAYLMLEHWGVGYWLSLLIAPIAVGATGS
jgi:branched-subunit amino acid ABC-type transport system permease component